MSGSAPEHSRATGAHFLPTHWSLVVTAGTEDSPHARAALESLCRAYWPPVYAEIRRRGHAPAEAEDLVQDFFIRLLRGEFFSRANREKGRFRSYLLGALNFFLADDFGRRNAKRRGGGMPLVSLDSDEGEMWFRERAANTLSPADAYDQRWALRLMDLAISRVKDDYEASGRSRIFSAVRPFLTADSGAGGYQQAANLAGMSARAFAVAVHRLRQRFRECVRQEVAMTVANPADLDDELRHLLGGV